MTTWVGGGGGDDHLLAVDDAVELDRGATDVAVRNDAQRIEGCFDRQRRTATESIKQDATQKGNCRKARKTRLVVGQFKTRPAGLNRSLRHARINALTGSLLQFGSIFLVHRQDLLRTEASGLCRALNLILNQGPKLRRSLLRIQQDFCLCRNFFGALIRLRVGLSQIKRIPVLRRLICALNRLCKSRLLSRSGLLNDDVKQGNLQAGACDVHVGRGQHRTCPLQERAQCFGVQNKVAFSGIQDGKTVKIVRKEL